MPSTLTPQPHPINASTTSKSIRLIQPRPSPPSPPYPPSPPPPSPAHPHDPLAPSSVQISTSEKMGGMSLPPAHQPHPSPASSQRPRPPLIDTTQDIEMQDIPLDYSQPSEWAARQRRARQQRRENRWRWCKGFKGRSIPVLVAVALVIATILVGVVLASVVLAAADRGGSSDEVSSG